MDSLSFLRKVSLYVGCAGLLVAALMTFKFGASMSYLHAIGLCLLTIAGSVIWPVIKHTWDARSFQTWAMIFCGVLFLGVEYFSHLGYTVGTRVSETQQTGVQNAAFKAKQDNLASETANLEMWRKQLAELKERNASHKDKNKGWLVSVDPTAMQAQVEAMDLKIENETARGGCKTKCEKLQDRKAELMAIIGSIKEENDLTDRIEATQRIVDGKVEKAATAEFKSSATVNQTNFVAQIATGNLNPDEMSLTWTQIVIGAFIAFVTTFLAPIMLNIAFGPETKRDQPRAMTETHAKVREAMNQAKPQHQAADPSGNLFVFGNSSKERALEILRQALAVVPERSVSGAA